MKKCILVIFLFCFGVTCSFAQKTPEELSNTFVAAFFHDNQDVLKSLLPPDEKVQKEMLARLKEVYDEGLKQGIKWNLVLTVSSGATLKEGKAGEAKKADLVISFSDSKGKSYKLSIWDCYEEKGQWKLGKKILLK